MKEILFSSCLTLLNATGAFTQLSGQSQVLYDSAYAQDPVLVNTALANGAQLFATPDNNSFYVQWFPTGASPYTTPLIVSLHGSGANAFMEFQSWFSEAQSHGCGIIALQWYRYNPNPPLDYFPDDTLYSYIDSALTTISYPSNKALLHGFSRGSARSYAMIFNDIQSGKNFFCTTISNAGEVDLGYPLYFSIDNGDYGSAVFTGKHWNLFCGPPEPPFSGGACDGMDFTQTWLVNQGAIVDIYVQDPLLGHNGFQLPSSADYKDSMLNNYLECFGATTSNFEIGQEPKVKIFPNPFSFKTSIHTEINFNDATLTVYNRFGQEVQRMTNLSGQQITFFQEDLPSGLYLLRLSENNELIASEKFIISD